MRRRLLSKMLAEQAERNMSAEMRARLVPSLNLIQAMAADAKPIQDLVLPVNPAALRFLLNDGVTFQGAAQSSPAGSVPPAQPAPKRRPGRPRKNLA